MEWWLVLVFLLGGLATLMLSGLPVAISFLLVDLVGAVVFLGGTAGLDQLILNIEESLTSFSLLPVPLFILMGEVLFHSGMGFRAIDVLEHWIGRIPGRLGFLAVVSATLFSTMSGSTMATTAMLGSLLVPEMERRGYKKPMSLGPVMGSGGLAMLIPPSALAILLATLSQVSVGGLLIAGVIPGLIIAALYATYILIRCWLQPSIAPPYEVSPIVLSKKFRDTAIYILPLGSIIFLVVGIIFLGMATPSEAAALGAIGTIVLARIYGRMNLRVLGRCLLGTIRVTAMMFMIIVGSMTFSQILAFSGASAGLIETIVGVEMPPVLLLIAMQVVLVFLGCFMDNLSMVMVAIPIYLPIVQALNFNPLWFSLLMLINMEMANTTPPFGLLLFVMKGVAPRDTTMSDIYRAGYPFLLCDAIVMILVMIFPEVALYLPGKMR